MSQQKKKACVNVVSEDEAAAVPAVAEVGRLVDCSQADDRRMIRLVRERPLLYARNNMPVASYYSQVKKLWQQVANKMGWTVADVRRKWSHIRNSYSRHLRNEMYGVRTGRGRMVSKWYLADELDFLRDHMATDTAMQLQAKRSAIVSTNDSANIERPSRYSYAEAGAALSSHSDGALEPQSFISKPWFTLNSPPRAAPMQLNTPLQLNTPMQLTVEPQLLFDGSSSPHSFEPDENSAYFHFFRGIHEDYLELPAKKQRLFRRECLAFLHRLLDEEEPHQQQDALNLSNSADTDDEKDSKMFTIETVEHCSNEDPLNTTLTKT